MVDVGACLRSFVVGACALAAFPAVAVADELPPPAVLLDLGIGSPVGVVGLVYTRPVHRRLQVEAGAGVGASGLILSAMGKLRIGGDHHAFTPGVGLSVGLPVIGTNTFNEGHVPNGDRGAAVTMPWLDVDVLAIETRKRQDSWVLTASLGITVALRTAHYDIDDQGGNVEPGKIYVQGRVGVGKTF